MTDSGSHREQLREDVARVVANAISTAYWDRLGGKVSTRDQSFAAADALLAVYPQLAATPIPEGTADELEGKPVQGSA